MDDGKKIVDPFDWFKVFISKYRIAYAHNMPEAIYIVKIYSNLGQVVALHFRI
jgi:hypothetical protein